MKITSRLEHDQLISQLAKIGIKGTDADVYLTLLRVGAVTMQQLTKQIKINRVTLHDSIKRLVEKGLVLETYSGKRKLIFPEQISKLTHLVDLKKTEVHQLEQDVSTTIGLLESLHHQSAYLPKVRIMKGQEGIQQMFREIANNKPDAIKMVTDSWHFDELLDVKFLDMCVDNANKTQLQIVLPAGFEHFLFSAKARGLQISSQILDDSLGRKGGMTLWEDKVALHAYEGVYITTTIIHNAPILQMMEACFRGMWGK